MKIIKNTKILTYNQLLDASNTVLKFHNFYTLHYKSQTTTYAKYICITQIQCLIKNAMFLTHNHVLNTRNTVLNFQYFSYIAL